MTSFRSSQAELFCNNQPMLHWRPTTQTTKPIMAVHRSTIRLVIVTLLPIVLCSCGKPAPEVKSLRAGLSCPEGSECLDFEASPLRQAWHNGNPATVNITDERAYSGAQSLRVDSTGGGYNQNYLSYTLDESPDMQTELYGRMMFWMSDKNAKHGDFTLVQTQGNAAEASGAPANTQVFYRARVDGRHDHLMANYDTWVDNDGDGKTDWLTDCWKHPHGAGDQAPPEAYRVPVETWSCLQWHFNRKTHQLDYWLNGVALSEINVKEYGDDCLSDNQGKRWLGPASFSAVNIGIEQYHPTAKARTVYIDDIAISHRAVPCPDSH